MRQKKNEKTSSHTKLNIYKQKNKQIRMHKQTTVITSNSGVQNLDQKCYTKANKVCVKLIFV